MPKTGKSTWASSRSTTSSRSRSTTVRRARSSSRHATSGRPALSISRPSAPTLPLASATTSMSPCAPAPSAWPIPACAGSSSWGRGSVPHSTPSTPMPPGSITSPCARSTATALWPGTPPRCAKTATCVPCASRVASSVSSGRASGTPRPTTTTASVAYQAPSSTTCGKTASASGTRISLCRARGRRSSAPSTSSWPMQNMPATGCATSTPTPR